MDIKNHTMPGIVSKFTFSSSTYSGEKGGSSLSFLGDFLSNLMPVSSIHLIDSGIHSLVPGFQNSVLNIDESQSALDLVGALEKSLLWHDVQAIERATVAPEGAASASLSSSSYHPNYNVSLPHHTTAVGSSGHYNSFSNLDLTKFGHADSDNVSVFYETAADGEFAEAADLPKEIPPLGYFPYENIGFLDFLVERPDHFAGRLFFEESAPTEEPVIPEIELLPPIADPNDYSFSASAFIEAGTSESPVFASVALQASQVFHCDLGNILTDPQNLSLPVSASNPVDSDSDGTLLLINSTSNPTLTIAGVAIDLASVTGPLPAGEVAEYEFTYQGNVGVLIISQDGTLSLETAATNLFGPLTPAQAALFSFDYNDRDADGLISNTAHVTINILGINDPPTAIDDFNQVQEVITDSGGNEGEGGEGENTLLLASSALTLNGADPRTIATGNILANDTDPDGSFAAGDFSVVSVTGHTFNNANGTWTFTISDEASGDQGSISGWQLTLQTDTNTYVFNNPTVLTILDNTTVSSDIIVSGVVGAITHVSLTLFDFQHTFFGDLVGTLKGSNDQSVDLFNRVGGGNDVNGNVTLDDSAGSSINGASQPISGTFQTSSGTVLNDFASAFPTTLVVHGLYGDFTVHQDGTYTYQLDTANPDVIRLGTDQTLEDSVPYTMQDSDGLISSAVLHIEILGTPNDPPIAQPNTYETDVDTIAPFVSGGYFVGNIRDDAGPLRDSDPDGNSFSVSSVINPILTIAGVDTALTPVLTSVPGSVAAYDFDYNGHTGTFTINENGAVILTASSGTLFLSELPVGQDLVFSFDYTDQDIRLAVSNTAHVDFTVHGDNAPPSPSPTVIQRM